MKKIVGRIPPVGNPITIKTSDELPEFPGALKTFFLNSGTAALAAGLQIAQAHCRAKKPEVIIPAYCCPDLLSAILYNNMKPVLVDFVPDRPYMDLNGIEKSLNENTVAVIAVNFLGIPERLTKIQALLKSRATLLLEDSAQWFPESDPAFAQHRGDMVIYSFGRGKPVCLLGGGALNILRDELLTHIPSHFSEVQIKFKNGQLHRHTLAAKYAAYNLMSSPLAYCLLELAPFLNVGATRFSELNAIGKMNADALQYIASNIEAYTKRNGELAEQMQARISKVLAPNALDLASACETYQKQRLLRQPVLFNDGNLRQIFLSATQNAGLGTSKLYPECLPKIDAVPPGVTGELTMPNATSFASRLATLPTHHYFRSGHCDKTINILGELNSTLRYSGQD